MHRLEILSPPGPSVGLAPGETRALRVRYTDALERPVPGARVGFSIQGSAGGAVLAAPHAITTDDGTAEMALIAGSVPAAFLVQVTAPHAVGVLFEVAVSEAGFTDLEVKPVYRGAHSQSHFAEVRVGLQFQARCADHKPLDPDTADRRRLLDSFGVLGRFESLPVDVSYALWVRGLDSGGKVLAWGCLDLRSGHLFPGVTLRVHLGAQDVLSSPRGTYGVLTDVLLPDHARGPLGAPLEASMPWASCPYGIEEILLDCVLDAAFPDALSDCVPESSDPQAVALRAHLGQVGADGCRGGQMTEGDPSLEQELRDSLDATGVAYVAALADFARVGTEGLTHLRIRSELQVVETPEVERFFTWHRLQALSFPQVAPDLWISLWELGAAPLVAACMPSSRDPGPPSTFAIPPHGLSLQPAWAAYQLAWYTVLRPAGLPRHPWWVFWMLLQHYWGPLWASQLQGCEAVTAYLCDRLGQSVSCLPDVCASAHALLESRIIAPWLALPDPTVEDVMLAASVVLLDEDGDLQTDRLGTPESPATWLMTLRLGEIWLAPLSATMDATRLPSQ